MISIDSQGRVAVYPEDRVLVALMPSPTDLEIARKEGWYRIPKRHAPKGVYAEYLAFYFGRSFGPAKWAIHFYARRLGHELVTRLSLFPDQPEHPRANDLYYKVQIGPLQALERPIPSLRWRRITFLHTTWDRFKDATEINDLFVQGGEYVDRLFAALKERGIHAERNYQVEEPDLTYEVALAVLCRDGRIDIPFSQVPQQDVELAALVTDVEKRVAQKGGLS